MILQAQHLSRSMAWLKRRIFKCSYQIGWGIQDYGNNKTVMNELKYMEENMRSMQEMKFPEHIPVLHFISESDCELKESWERLHNEIVTENIRSETIRLEGGHYLHFEQTEEIAKEIREWIIVEKMIYR